MRRSLLAIPAVVALGAGGFLVLHHEAKHPRPSAHVPDSFTTRDGRVLPSPFASAPEASVHVAPAAGPTPPPASEPTQSTTAATSAPERPALPQASTAPVASPAPPRPQAQTTRDFMRHANGSASHQPAVPMPGLSKFQAKLATQQKCQSLEGEKKYAGLTGDARHEYAEACQRVGITLPP